MASVDWLKAAFVYGWVPKAFEILGPILHPAIVYSDNPLFVTHRVQEFLTTQGGL